MIEKNLFWAAQIAKETKNEEKNFLLGCIALRKDGAYVYSINETVSQEKTPSAHAEFRALRKAGHGSILWVARILKNGTWAMAKPCQSCATLIINKKVEKVYYTVSPGKYGIWLPRRTKGSKMMLYEIDRN